LLKQNKILLSKKRSILIRVECWMRGYGLSSHPEKTSPNCSELLSEAAFWKGEKNVPNTLRGLLPGVACAV
jgi:hypothetical protein